jgi:DNA helicase-4
MFLIPVILPAAIVIASIIIGVIVWRHKTRTGLIEQLNPPFTERVNPLFVEQLNPLVVAAAQLVDRYNTVLDFSSGYLMKKDYDELIAAVTPIATKLLEIPEPYRNAHAEAERIKTLLAYCANNNLREQRNDAYKAHEMEACAGLFDDIGGKCLDAQQRDAIVTDEYSNLVIAGAGSGKTLTVVGKLKYLVERWGVNPAEILVTSFTRKSVDELAQRIAAAGITGVSTRTFHALGLSVLDKPGVANENELKNCILRYLNSKILESAQQVQAYLEFYGCYSYIPQDYEEYENAGEMYADLKSVDLVTIKGKLDTVAQGRKITRETLRGERVNSLEELIIANHLFLNGVRYEYEKVYPGAYEAGGNRAYQPDFYLPEYDIWLEHFGIDEEGRAPWLVTDYEEKKYLDGMRWKRGVHRQNGTRLIESYSFWNQDNRLIDYLDNLLVGNGIELKSDIDELVRLYEELCQEEKFSKSMLDLISTFVSLFKANNTTLDAVSARAEAAYRDESFMRHRYQLFITFVEPIINFYSLTLREKGLIDFDDMINRATRVIRERGISENYRYIIVDEYQDISRSRFDLISAIRDQTGAKLVCVGDDWQSIYRFAGSDVTLFTSFEAFSGYHEKMQIEGTYRNSQALINIASKFIMQNSNQLPKVMKSKKPQQNLSPVVIMSQKDQVEALAQALDEILMSEGFVDSDGSILILGRHNFDFDTLFSNRNHDQGSSEVLRDFSFKRDERTRDIQITYRGYSNIRFLSVHRAKGLEADEVIIINLINDKYGFPNKIADDPLLNLLLADSDDYPYAEERRLFYVAMTRTKNNVYLITSHIEDYKGSSVFVNEIEEDNDSESIRLISEENERAPINCPRCGQGVFVIRRNKMNGREFLGCTNYPFCDKTYSDTEILNHQVKCPQCGGWMVKRSGSYGDFYGCTNYPACRGTIDISDTDKLSYVYINKGYQVNHNEVQAESTARTPYGHVDNGFRAVPRCPKCGGPMVKRVSEYGSFYGCSKYPSCNGKRKIR